MEKLNDTFLCFFKGVMRNKIDIYGAGIQGVPPRFDRRAIEWAQMKRA